jgi:hypothetical protein
MTKKKIIPELETEEVPLADNEDFISRDDIEIEVMLDETNNTVAVRFRGFEDSEDAEEYAEFLAETLPLLLFETTRMQ